MPTPRTTSTRQRALHAALQVLHDEGYAAVTMRSVAESAGVTATALYRHFADRDELVGEMVREVSALLRDRIGQAMEQAQPFDRLLGSLVAVREFALDAPRYYEFLFLTRLGPPRRYPDGLGARGRGDFAALVRLVEECMDEGTLERDDPQDVALTLVSHLHGTLRHWWLGRFGTDRAAFAGFCDESFVRLFRGLSPPHDST